MGIKPLSSTMLDECVLCIYQKRPIHIRTALQLIPGLRQYEGTFKIHINGDWLYRSVLCRKLYDAQYRLLNAESTGKLFQVMAQTHLHNVLSTNDTFHKNITAVLTARSGFVAKGSCKFFVDSHALPNVPNDGTNIGIRRETGIVEALIRVSYVCGQDIDLIAPGLSERDPYEL